MRARLLALVALVSSLACVHTDASPAACPVESLAHDRGAESTSSQPSTSDDPLLAQYELALEVARYPTPERAVDSLLALEPGNAALRWDPSGRVLVTTWTRAKFYAAPEYQTGYAFALYGETWFTAGDQVQAICSASGKTGDDLDLRLEQLLGIPPGATYDAFLQVWIDPAALFRPCADPSVTTTTCPLAAPLSSTAPDQVGWDCSAPTDAHAQWLCNSWAVRYGNSDPLRQYPWTALGYTYDWSPDNPTGVGPSEFVAKAKTPVVFEQLLETERFCATP
jgi:hypothetical protein